MYVAQCPSCRCIVIHEPCVFAPPDRGIRPSLLVCMALTVDASLTTILQDIKSNPPLAQLGLAGQAGCWDNSLNVSLARNNVESHGCTTEPSLYRLPLSSSSDLPLHCPVLPTLSCSSDPALPHPIITSPRHPIPSPLPHTTPHHPS